MRAASDDRLAYSRDGKIEAIPLDGGATQTIYLNTLVCHDTTGYAVSGADTVGYVLAGVAKEHINITATETDGTHNVLVQRNGVHRFAIASAAATNVGAPVWLTDDKTVQLTPSNVFVGTIQAYVSATEVDVDITPGVSVGTVRKIITISLKDEIVQGETYKIGIFVAHKPCKVLAAKFANVEEANTDGAMAIDNYGSGQTTPGVRRLLSTATISISGITALTPIDLTLSSTAANLLMAEDDMLYTTIVAGATVTTAGEGLVLTVEIEEYGLPNAA